MQQQPINTSILQQLAQLSPLSISFLTSTSQELPLIKLHKYRHYLASKRQPALQIFQHMAKFALQHFLIGEYQQLYEIIKQEINKTEQYKQQRQQMVSISNPLRQQIQHAQSISGFEQTVHLYFKIASYYKSIGMHRQSAQYFSKLFRLQSTSTSKIVYQRWQYFSLWAQELYLDNNFTELGIFLRNQIEDEKKTDVNLVLIKDLKFIEMEKFQNSNKLFINLITSTKSSQIDLTKNQIISLEDLGLLSSLLMLAHSKRQQLKNKSYQWSSNIEVFYLRNDFKKLFQKLQQEYVNRGIFNFLIDKIYRQSLDKIRERVLVEYLSVYREVSFADVQKYTSFREGQVLQYLNSHPGAPYLVDPITQSLIYRQKTIPLEQQTVEYGLRVREKWRETIRGCLKVRASEEAESRQLTGIQQGGRT